MSEKNVDFMRKTGGEEEAQNTLLTQQNKNSSGAEVCEYFFCSVRSSCLFLSMKGNCSPDCPYLLCSMCECKAYPWC